MIATATVAAVGNARMFKRGRDMAACSAWFRDNFPRAANPLSVRSASEGTSTFDGSSSKARKCCIRHLARDRSSLGAWLRALEARTHRNVAVVALANKLVRICWKVLSGGHQYRPYPARAT